MSSLTHHLHVLIDIIGSLDAQRTNFRNAGCLKSEVFPQRQVNSFCPDHPTHLRPQPPLRTPLHNLSCAAGELQNSGPVLRPVTIWKIRACATVVMEYFDITVGCARHSLSLPLRIHIYIVCVCVTGEGYVSHFTTDIKYFLLFHWAWQKGLIDTLNEFSFGSLIVVYFQNFVGTKEKSLVCFHPLCPNRRQGSYGLLIITKKYWSWHQFTLFKI